MSRVRAPSPTLQFSWSNHGILRDTGNFARATITQVNPVVLPDFGAIAWDEQKRAPRYARLIAEHAITGSISRQAVDDGGITVSEVILAFWKFAKTWYLLTLTDFKPWFSAKKTDVAARFQICHPVGYQTNRRREWILRYNVGQFSEIVSLRMIAIEQAPASGKFVCRSPSRSMMTSGTTQRKSES